MHSATNTPTKRLRRTADQWRAIVRRFQKSSLTPRDFCKRENLSLTSFDRWHRRLLSEDNQPGFTELQPPTFEAGGGRGTWTVEIDLPGGGSLRIRSGQ